jgi:Lrp/AsnC family transcriptional regulator for asnA, asnC and gidA
MLRDMGQRPAEEHRLDAIDREIVRALQRNGRTSNTDIGRALGLTETTIRKRIARLVSHDLVRIVAVPSPEAVGMNVSAIIGVSVQLGSLDRVAAALKGYREVRYVALSTGRYDIIIEAFFGDSEHLLHFVSEKLGDLSEVTRVETSVVLRVDKLSFEWEIPPEDELDQAAAEWEPAIAEASSSSDAPRPNSRATRPSRSTTIRSQSPSSSGSSDETSTTAAPPRASASIKA